MATYWPEFAANGKEAVPHPGLDSGYLLNRMGFGDPTDPREVRLRDAPYSCLGGPRQAA